MEYVVVWELLVMRNRGQLKGQIEVKVIRAT